MILEKLQCGVWIGESTGVGIAPINSSLLNERQCFAYTYSIFCYSFKMLTMIEI